MIDACVGDRASFEHNTDSMAERVRDCNMKFACFFPAAVNGFGVVCDAY